MKSAFGVDHGSEEFGKAIPGVGMMTRLGAKLGSGAQKAGIGIQNRGAGVLKQVQKTPHPNPKFNAGANKIGEGYLHAGGALHTLGTKMAARPGLTGGLAAGGAGAAGLGAAKGMFGQKKQIR